MKKISSLILLSLLSQSLFGVDAIWLGTPPDNDVAQNTDWNNPNFWKDAVVPNNTADVKYDVYFDVDQMPAENFTTTGGVADLSNWDYYWTVNSITFNGKAVSKINSGGGNADAFIATVYDFKKIGNDRITICRGKNVNFNIDVGRDLIVGADSYTRGGELYLGGTGGLDTDWNGALGNVKVAGDVYLYNKSVLALNVSKANSSYDNPDVKIDGIVKAVGLTGQDGKWENATFMLLNQSEGTAHDSYVSIGGINGHMQVLGGWGGSKLIGSGTGYMVLTNKAGVSTKLTGQIQDGSSATKLGIIMNGEGKQTIDVDYMRFTGGVQVINGTIDFEVSKKKWNNATSSEISHGDLNVKGGKLILRANYSEGSFGFNDFFYAGGTIEFVVGAYGTPTIQLAGKMYAHQDISQPYMGFEFTGNAYELIGEANIAKIVGWDIGNSPTDFDESSFAANTIVYGDASYDAVFKLLEDGLYVYYTEAIPEPATLAMIISAIAGFVCVIRRRK